MRDLRWLALCIVVSGVMQAPFTSYSDFGSALHSGDGRVQAWVLAWVGHAIEQRRPLFDANMFFPARGSLAHTDHMAALGLVGLPIWLLTHNAILVFNLLKLLGPALGAWATARLAHRWTGDDPAALVAGLVYGCSSFTLLHNAHLNLTWSAGIPLALLGVERWWVRPSWPRLALWWSAALFTVLVSWYLGLMLALTLVTWMVWLLTTVGNAQLRVRALQMLSSGVLALAIVLPFAAPYLGRGSEAGEAAAFAADWQSYLVPHEHTVIGRWLVSSGVVAPQGIWGERTLFLGWLLVAFACVGAVTALAGRRRASPDDRRSRVLFLLLLAFVAAALSFGPSATGLAPFDLLVRLPGAAGFRAAARFGLLVTLACALLAAFGLAWLRGTACRPALREGFAVACAVIMLGEVFVVDFPPGRPTPEPMPEIYRLAADDGAQAAVALPMYAGEPQWFLEGDYLLYSTTGNFLPLANGIGRWIPPEYLAMGEATRTFPSPECAAALRFYGISHVLFHGARFGAAGPRLLARAAEGADFTIVATRGPDALLHVKSPPLAFRATLP